MSTLKPNRVLADIVESYKNVRKELHALVVNDKINDNKNELHSLKTKSEIKTVILKKLPLQTFHNEPLARIKDFISNVFKSNYPNSKVSFNLNGDKATLERRYREFLHMHNSQVESPTALSLEEVIKLINQIEINKSNLAKSESASLPILEAVKDGKVSAITFTFVIFDSCQFIFSKLKHSIMDLRTSLRKQSWEKINQLSGV